MVLGSIEDLVLTPQGQVVRNSTDAADIAAVARARASISNVNSRLLNDAVDHDIPFVDFYHLGDDILADGTTLMVGGVPIRLAGSGSDPHFFWIDRLHPGIIGNAILGNMWMSAINAGYGTNLTLYSDQEMLNFAGLSSSYTGETFSASYDLSSDIHLAPVPEPSTFALVGIAGVCVVSFRRKQRRWIRQS